MTQEETETSTPMQRRPRGRRQWRSHPLLSRLPNPSLSFSVPTRRLRRHLRRFRPDLKKLTRIMTLRAKPNVGPLHPFGHKQRESGELQCYDCDRPMLRFRPRQQASAQQWRRLRRGPLGAA